MTATPSIKTLLAIPSMNEETAKALRNSMRNYHSGSAFISVDGVMEYANRHLMGYGVEYLPGQHESMTSPDGLEYVNLGDTYIPTLCFDWRNRKFRVASWGDIVENNPRRFA